MLFVTESKNSILLWQLKSVFDVLALLWLWPRIYHKFSTFCHELTVILSIFGQEKFTA